MDKHPDRERAVELPLEPDIALGPVKIRPPACEIEFKGETTRIEPRVMQVLVVLARARGDVVSRAELVNRCWGGRIVGEDAINRALLKLRKLPFDIETIPKVGYRLNVAGRATWRSWRVGVAALALLAVVASLAAWTIFRPADDWQVGAVEVIVGENRAEGWPSISPDGRMLAYTVNSADQDLQSAIWVRSVAGGDPVLFASDTHSVAHAPAWSREGDRIAFVRIFPERPDGRHDPCAIIVKPFPAGAEHVVAKCRSDRFLGRLDWSPGGSAIYFSERVDGPNGPRVVRRLDLARRTVTSVTRPTGLNGDFNATVSPGGDRLAFVRYPSTGAAQVFVQNLKTRGLQRVTSDAIQAWLAWSPDGRSLFVAARHGNSFELQAVDPAGRRPLQRLLATTQDIIRPSAGNGVIAFETRKQVMELGWLRGDDREVVATGGRLLYPDISAHGDLAYVEDGNPPRLMVQRAGGPAHRVLDLPPAGIQGLTWSPDGQRIAFKGVAAGVAQLFVADVAGGALRPLKTPGIGVSMPAWTGDGRNLVFAGDDGRGSRIWRMTVDGAAPAVPVSARGWSDALPGPSGEIYAVRAGEPGVWRLDHAGAATQAAPAPAPVYGQDWNWLVRNKRIWVLTDAGGDARLLSWALDGHDPKVQAMPSGTEAVAVDPRSGQLLVLRQVRNDADIGLVHLRRR